MNRALDAFTLPICVAQPRRNDALSAWTEHIPFAMNLVALLRPEVLVELGTLMKNRWDTVLCHDPYYSPHLSREVEDYRLRVS